MVNILKYFVLSFVFFMGMGKSAFAQIRQMMFEKIDTYNGLGDDRIYHILQANDGRMIFTTHDVMSVYDAHSFHNVPHTKGYGMPLKVYNGAYHCYVGAGNLLWIKDNHSLRCLDVKSLSFVKDCDALLQGLTGCNNVVDMFCDTEGKVWCVSSDNRLVAEGGKSVSLPNGNGELQDLIDDHSYVYLFFSNTSVVVLNKKTLKTVHSSRAFDDDRYSGTSLVVATPNNKLYQLRNGFDKGACLCYDTKNHTWKTVIELPYIVHTITVANDRAYITTQQDMWEVDSNNDEAIVISRLLLDGTPILPKQMNSVYVDNQGGVWIGSYANGLLYSHPSHVSQDSLAAIGLEDYAESKKNIDYPLMPMLVAVRIDDASFSIEDAMKAKIMVSDTLYVSFEQKEVELTFSALNYPHTHVTRYLVRMPEVDSLWHEPDYFGGMINASGSLVLGNMPLCSGLNKIEVQAVLGKSAYDYTMWVSVEEWWIAVIPKYLILAIVLIHIAICLWAFVVRGAEQEESEVNTEVVEDVDSSEPIVESEPEMSSPFIDKVRELVIANLSVKGYSVEQLSEDLCMERTGLYKKLTALTGVTPSAYIRSIRLERAIVLLREGKMGVQDVAESVGFSSASYMSRCFVAEYGCTPLEYIKEHK